MKVLCKNLIYNKKNKDIANQYRVPYKIHRITQTLESFFCELACMAALLLFTP